MFTKSYVFIYIQCDQKVCVYLMITVQKTKQKYFKVSITYHDNVVTIRDNRWCAILNTVFENTVRRVNKRLETGGGHFERYL
jgi:hypothetical protein